MENELHPIQAKYHEVSRLVGDIIVACNNMEVDLFAILKLTIRPKNQNALSAAFFNVTSNSQKLAMVDSAVIIAFHDNPNIIEPWRKLSDKVAKAIKTRNKIAHYNMIPYFTTKGDLSSFKCFVQQSPENMAEHVRTGMDPSKLTKYTNKDLAEINKNIRDLHAKLQDFCWLLP